MLAVLLEIPTDAADWGRFAWNNLNAINLINEAILAQYKIELPTYILFPLDITNPTQWLQNNQAAHTNFNAVLGLQSHDLQQVDINNPDQVADWVNLNYQELMDASMEVGVS